MERVEAGKHKQGEVSRIWRLFNGPNVKEKGKHFETFCRKMVRCDVFKIAKGMVKTNQAIIGQQCVRNDDGELKVSYKNKKIAWESHHEKLLKTEFVNDRNSFSCRYS